ncbi:MAG: EAL domain-containing protein [Actinobacteria bacterium]|nr:EAL domain-containing protein [Actinomycetota bacterium]
MTRGDHIYVGRVGYPHHGIDVGDGRVIHYSGEPGKSKSHAIIRYATLQEFTQGCEVKVRRYDRSFDPDETVHRAESKLGERDYDLFRGNCEYFASWCVTGRNISGQINGAVAVGGLGTTALVAAPPGGAVSGVAVLGAAAGLVGAGTMVDGPGRTWSLRREWSRAFSIMLLLLLFAASATIVGGRMVVNEVEGTLGQLRLESDTVAVLRTQLFDHEQRGHQLLSGKPVNRSAFAQQQQEISRLFDHAVTVFPAGNMRATIVKAHQSWQQGLMTVGLWGDQVRTLHGDHSADNAILGPSSGGSRAMLDGLADPSLEAMGGGVAYGADLERILVALLIGLFVLALAVTVYFHRRMVKDLMRPVATMHEGVLKLQAGDYRYRIEVARRDELGELAQAFNGMADSLHDSHLALTLRATHDSLTGLANRAALTERLTASFCLGSDRRTRQESLLFIDIDDFKEVNDSLGHEGGDALLTQLATRLNGCVRAHDLVARLGGDEFAIVVIEDAEGDSVAVEVAERILNALRAPFIVGGDRLVVTVSIGVAQRRPETVDAAELLRQADFAMYMAKGGGKARYQLFDAQMHDHMVDRSALKTDLASAVASAQLRLEYQPVADLRTGEIVGVEALVRWQHPNLGLLAPGEFIPLAEETGDIDAIGCWVLDTATRQVAGWRQTMDHCASLWVAVNHSAFQLPKHQSLAAIQRILADPAVEADKVVLEVTETALATDVDGGIVSLNMLKGFGVRIAIDDFGTGFSSLSTLAGLPVDILKIDRSFVSGQTSAGPSVPMLESILRLAKKLSLAVIAEGIEEPEQLDILGTLGCRMGQGYLLARPAPAHVIEALLASGGLPQPGSITELGGVRGS